MSQIGARHLARKNKIKAKDEEVCVSHYQSDVISIPVKDGVRKRPRVLKRKAD